MTASGATRRSGLSRRAPSNQLSLVVDPPDGRIPPLTPEGQKRDG